jgi:hypothetical protein
VSASARAPRVAVIAEFYPSRRDPVLGVWAHRQALAALCERQDFPVLRKPFLPEDVIHIVRARLLRSSAAGR